MLLRSVPSIRPLCVRWVVKTQRLRKIVRTLCHNRPTRQCILRATQTYSIHCRTLHDTAVSTQFVDTELLYFKLPIFYIPQL